MAQLFISQLSQRKMLFQYLNKAARQTRQAKKLTYLDFLSPASDKAGYTKEWKKQPPVYRSRLKLKLKQVLRSLFKFLQAGIYLIPTSKYEKALKKLLLLLKEMKYKQLS